MLHTRFALSLAAFALVTVAGGTSCAPAAVTTSPVAVAAAVDVVGTWKNERGSLLVIDAVLDGKLQGSFRSAVGNVDPSKSFTLVGVVRGDVIGFTVDFGAAGSVASWVGQVEGETLRTQWHLSRDVSNDDEASKLWSSTMSGADAFVRQ